MLVHVVASWWGVLIVKRAVASSSGSTYDDRWYDLIKGECVVVGLYEPK